MNLLRKLDSDIGHFSRLASETYGQSSAHYLLQGRDDNRGQLVPSQSTLRLGSQMSELLGK